jgi:hypothetical protein
MTEISETFGKVVQDIKGQMESSGHNHPVDIEMSFDSLEVKQGGIPIISKRTQKKEMTIKLATRITPQ